MSNIPYSCYVPKGPLTIAFSGGPDSVFAAEHFIQQRREITLLHVNHGTPASREMEHAVRNWCCFKPVELVIHNVDPANKLKDESWEEFWRSERLDIFHAQSTPVVTGHNLDDQIETYLFNAFHGAPRLMPSSNGNVLRPFLYMTKEEMRSRITSRKYFVDPSNADVGFARNRIRHNIVPEVRKINSGIEKTIKKMMREAEYGRAADADQSGRAEGSGQEV